MNWDEEIERARGIADSLWAEALDIWLSGGWAMIGIGVIALVIFGMGAHVWLELRAKGFTRVPERTWRRWLDRPAERVGAVGELIDSLTGGAPLGAVQPDFEQVRAGESRPFERDLLVMRICVSAAPLIGLLGTVMGMLSTFGALAGGSGGDKTMSMVAKGISEALITTETGLVIALPGLFLQYHLVRKHEKYKAFLAHLETICAQTVHRRGRALA